MKQEDDDDLDQDRNGEASKPEKEKSEDVAEADLRFHKEPYSAFGPDFKKQNKEEERLSQKLKWKSRFRKTAVGSQKGSWINVLISLFDFSFSLYVCVCIAISVFFIVTYAIQGDLVRTLCLSIVVWLLVKINEKISR